jgi:hypothetical protein
VALILGPLFPEPLNTIQPTLVLENIPEKNSKLKGSSSLLQSIRKYCGDAIQKRIDIIQEIWDLSQSIANFHQEYKNSRNICRKTWRMMKDFTLKL